MTVPPRDLVAMAKTKVGMATINSGRARSRDRVVLSVISAGNRMALKMAAGIKSSHSTSQEGKLRLVK